MLSQKTQKKIHKGVSTFFVHLLLYIAGSVLYFVFAISHILNNISVVSLGSILSTIKDIIILGLGWVLFSIVWLFAARKIHSFRNSLRQRREAERTVEGTSLTRKEIDDFLSQGRVKAKQIEESCRKIENRSICNKVYQIVDTVRKIYSFFEDEPAEIRKGRRFTDHYLSSTVKIIEKYSTYSDYRESSPDISKSHQNIEASLDIIETGFEKQLAKLLEHDAMDVDAELKVLKSALKAEDF